MPVSPPPPLTELWPACGESGFSSATALGTRARNGLAREGLLTPDDVVKAGRPGVARIWQFGHEVLDEIDRALRAAGYPALPDADTGWEPSRNLSPRRPPQKETALTRDIPGITGESPTVPLRQAASLLREHVARLGKACHTDWGDRPWAVTECADPQRGNCACIVYQGECRPFNQPQVPLIQYVADAETEAHAAYIASMHPAVASALARWLEAEANAYDVWEGACTDEALAVARACLAGPGPTAASAPAEA